MKSVIYALIIAAAPAAALAHPGHVTESSGHSHWLALVILGGLGIALLGWASAAILHTVKKKWQA